MQWISPIVLALIVTPLSALSEEVKPCKATGNAVVCTRPGFDALVAKTLDFQKDAEACALHREYDAARLRVIEARLKQSLAETALARAELDVERSRPKPWVRRFTSVGLGVLGGVAAFGAAQVESDAAALGLGGLSLASLATAVVLVALE